MDDEPKLVEIARKFLENSGFSVLTAGDAHNLIPERENIGILSKPNSLSQLVSEMRRLVGHNPSPVP